jgi:lipoprotein NlpI
MLGQDDDALADYTKSLSLNPSSERTYNNRGYARLGRGDLDGALADLSKAIELKPSYATAYGNRGFARSDEGDMAGAMDDFNQAVRLDPNWGRAVMGRGYVQYNSQSFRAALSDFRRALELKGWDPDYIHFRIWLARCRLGEKDAATKELRDYFGTRNTGRPDGWQVQIGRFLAGQLAEADFLKAAESADKTKSDGQHCEAWFYSGSVRLLAGDKVGAKDAFEKCLATGTCTFGEWISAKAELKQLQKST